MVEIKIITDNKLLSVLGAQEGEQLFAAFENGELIGLCKYRLAGRTVLLLDLQERNGDLLLADGIARAAISSCEGLADRVQCEKAGVLPAFMASSGWFDRDGQADLKKVLKGKCSHQRD